ncbi:unnamed protein product [Leuciscus chuanchicus]
MNNPTLTQPGEENTCSPARLWLATCREGWEFLQREAKGVAEEEERYPYRSLGVEEPLKQEEYWSNGESVCQWVGSREEAGY